MGFCVVAIKPEILHITVGETPPGATHTPTSFAAKAGTLERHSHPCHLGAGQIFAPNRVNREFTVDAPDLVWVTDITYIQTWQG